MKNQNFPVVCLVLLIYLAGYLYVRSQRVWIPATGLERWPPYALSWLYLVQHWTVTPLPIQHGACDLRQLPERTAPRMQTAPSSTSSTACYNRRAV